jgi:hypothetical protein
MNERIEQAILVNDNVAIVMNYAVGAIDLSRPDRVTVSGITVCGQNIRQTFMEAVKKGGETAYRQQGTEAFKTPKAAAAGHEAGHVIVGTTLGYSMQSTRLIEYQPGMWGGITHHKREHKPGATVGPDEALRQARMLYAGVAAEKFLRSDFRHAASSLDELIMSQMIAAAFVAGKDEDQETCWNTRVHDDVIARLKAHHALLQELGNALFKIGRLAGKRLRTLIANVKVMP